MGKSFDLPKWDCIMLLENIRMGKCCRVSKIQCCLNGTIDSDEIVHVCVCLYDYVLMTAFENINLDVFSMY